MTQTSETENTFKYKVLVIDDEARIRDVAGRMLSKDGFEVATAPTGEAGMRMIDEEHFDIILLDLMMPGLSGLEVLPRLKARHPYSVVIVITGYATLEYSIEAMKKGAFDFIPKPFSPRELRIVIAKAIEFIGNLHDIANEKSRLSVLVDRISGGVMATDVHKRVALANPAFLKMVDYFGDEAIGRKASEVLGNRAMEVMIDRILSAPDDMNAELTEELDLGSKIVSIRCVPFRDRLDRVLGTITVLNDITALKKMDRLKSDFVSMVAHEIRSPLNTIGMQINVILDGLAGEVTEKQGEILGRAYEKIRMLSDLSTELLDLARIESELINQEMESVEMGPLLEAQTAFFQEAARSKGISLELQPLPVLPRVLANRRNMEEVFSNLVSNALNYTPDGGKVVVRAEGDENHLRLCVSDNGLGIGEENRERIFERFFRVKDENTVGIVGTGLGLPIVKSIVDAHNGKIEVRSEPGRGSEFHVCLPIIRPRP